MGRGDLGVVEQRRVDPSIAGESFNESRSAGLTAGLDRLGARYRLPDSASATFERLLEALAAEPDPPTTVRDPSAAVEGHVADSLVALELGGVRRAARIADIGSGAGFPGLVLAVALPGAAVELVESSRRKCELIDRLIVAAGMVNARSVPLRVEELAAGDERGAYDLVTARALASLPVLVEYAAPLLRAGGALVAWKGARDRDEERAGDRAAEQVGLSHGEVTAVEPFPGAHSRHLHVFVKREATPDRFPRRPGMAAKRPLA